jgi:DUF1009 family protein
MGPRIGLIAGSGEFPLLVLNEIKKQGVFCAVLGIGGPADDALRSMADAWARLDAGRAAEAIAFFREHGVRDILLVGKIDPGFLFGREDLDETSRSLVDADRDKRPSAVVRRAIAFLSGQGLEVADPAPFLAPYFCPEGLLTATGPAPAAQEDIDFGWPLARTLADQDIGQTLVVKDKAVVAVEGLEGTDEAIRRGGRLAGPGTIVIKVSRTHQDMRVDVPAVGLETVRSLSDAGSAVLCVEAGRVAFFQKQEAAALAESNGVSLVVRKGRN